MTRKLVSQEKAAEVVWELAYLRATNKISPKRFVQLVNNVNFVEPQYAPYPFEGYIPGTFDIIKEMYMDGVISKEEYVAIADDRPLDV